jgi:hypothetical protein
MSPTHLRENPFAGLLQTATDFMKHAASVHMSNDRQQIMQVESPEQVAEKIAEAIRTEAAEVYAESLTSRG